MLLDNAWFYSLGSVFDINVSLKGGGSKCQDEETDSFEIVINILGVELKDQNKAQSSSKHGTSGRPKDTICLQNSFWMAKRDIKSKKDLSRNRHVVWSGCVQLKFNEKVAKWL